MKNGLFLTILLLLAASSFAQDYQNRYLFIEGSASRMDHREFFQRSFVMEAGGCGYVVTDTRSAALHTLSFRVVPDYDPEYEIEQFIITMSLSRNADGSQLISFNFAFETIEEMYPFVRTLFLNSVTSIPLPLLTEQNHWYKWIYLRASFDYPLTFYILQDNGLVGGIGVYNADRTAVESLDHVIRAMPGATLGAEFQFLNFMSLEANFQLSMGDTRNNYFVNMGVGAELKVPVKLRNIMLVPYGAFLYPLYTSPVFAEFPLFEVGAGMQVCARAGKRGIVFLDTKFMFSFIDAVMHNPHKITPVPDVIHYKRYYLGLGVGYKFGILDRPKKTATFTY